MSKKPLSVILVRWPKGTERVNVTPNDTIGDVVNRMAKKHDFDGTKLTLILESNKTKIARITKLSQLKISNGEMFQLDMPSLPPTPSSSSLSQSSTGTSNSRPSTANKENKGPLPPNVQRFKSIWGENAKCLSEVVGETIIIEQQESCKIKKVLLPQKECAMAAHIIEELHFMTMRIFFLYGTVPHDNVVRIHAISMPSQRFDAKTGNFIINEQHKKSSDDLAKTLGLKLLGVIIPNSIKSPPINPNAMVILGKMAQEIGDDFIVCSATPDAGKCVFEVYQLSNQFIKLASEDFFTGTDGKDCLKTEKEVRAYSKLTDKLAVEYFLINVASIPRVSWFPKTGFPFQAFYPTVSDFAYAMNLDYQLPNFIRLLDFNCLLFLEQWFNPGNEIPMLTKTLIKKKELPFSFSSKIDEIISSASISGY